MIDIPSRPQSILIVRLSAIGDVVHTMPALGALRDRYPDIRIGWLVEELSAQLLQGHPDINDLFIIPKRRWRQSPVKYWLNGEKRAFYKRIRNKGYDVAVDFQGLTKSGFAAWMSGAKYRIGYGDKDGRELNKLFTNCKVSPTDDQMHVIERNLSLLSAIDIRPRPEEIRWRFPDFSDEKVKLRPFLERIGDSKPIMLYPGAGWPTKCWPVEHFADLTKAICGESALENRPVVLLWGPAEETAARKILSTAGKHCNERLLMAPPTNLRELTALLDEADIVTGGDTGPIHIAAALGKPVVGLYGASDPERNGPWGGQHKILTSDTCAARPCWKHDCSRALDTECMRDIQPAEVLSRILEIA